ncbi:LysM peptidoglycan-binding domain-containing protein [Streptococcus thermophilus]|uniref:LysM peptidoglycan-binding domain-containing protein n=1 Tax=Streptococcus thermophilus TaxID=1308 RepID=A0A3G6JXX9_STRTR|nr:LysM domain-containing protein [Streptococcus thermophilus]AZA17680.1 MAG: LysM peptidoglycan-binding domain-containing protein [Streptococcus thermophilus]AZA23032.1 MAG: peptidoglycan-binding protein LysM [Streptococcus thermophilus]MBO1149040.1 LysM peptidoglycan-binding domain-containing protein [Streptococcus thermophilus]MBO1158764.1 LysM peptidoglycan-binding domain-containing protein [Streptococcus thermophilus]MBO1160451.1 LysM peptidoglycan-binding domain-containing protein [Strep
MLSKSKTTKALLYSTAALSLFAASHVHADETSHWTARSVDQIKADISVNDNQQTYTVQYGDTLGSIAEAMGIDVNVLANINEITNIDLIFPGTVLTTTYNADNQAVSVKVETPSSETSDTPVVAESNLTTNEVTVNGQSVVAADLSAPVETVSLTATQAPAKEESTQVVSEVTEAIASASDTPAYADTEQPVADAIDHVTSSAEETLAEEEAPATETSAQAETTEVAAASEAASDAPAEQLAAASEAPESSEVPAEQLAAASEAPESSEAPAEQPAAAPESSEAPAKQPAVTSEVALEAPATSETPATQPASTNTLPTNPNLQPQAEAFRQDVAAKFGLTNIGGYREGDPQDHGKGRAVDVMVPVGSEVGNQVAQYAVDNIANAGISYVIYRQHFYAPVDNIYGPANTWNQMPDRGSITENHYDHVHVSFNA